jgi:Leucine-rich repeat (LRR) protein
LAVLVGLILLAAAVVVGVVCGGGKCSSSASSSSSTTLTKSRTGAEIAALINSVSLLVQATGETIPLATGSTPEAQALAHLIDSSSFAVVGGNKNRDIGSSVQDWQYIQRYALLTLWFTNGPWDLSSSASSPDTMVDAPAAPATTTAAPATTWFGGSDDCQWAGVECHDNDGRVTRLRLEQVGLRGTVLPRDLGLLTALSDLHLYGNLSMNITLVATLQVLRPLSSTLRSLDLRFSGHRGTIPADDLAALTMLTALRLGGNALTGTLPDDTALWSSLTAIRALDLSHNSDLGGRIPTALTASLTSLTQLSLGFCGFIAPLPDQELERMPDLMSLSLGHPYADAAPNMTNLSGLSKLTELELFTSAVSQGSIPSDVVDWWPAMAKLTLYAGLTGTIPSSLARWTSLRHFDMSNNMLTGSIATEVFPAWSGSLTGLAVNDNELGGTLPAQIGLLSKLEVLLMVNNDFFGPLPTAIGSLTGLKLLDLAGNRLSGTIPVAVLNLTNAFYVSLERNNFTGMAPYCAAAADDIIVPINVLVDCQAVVCPCCKRCSD